MNLEMREVKFLNKLGTGDARLLLNHDNVYEEFCSILAGAQSLNDFGRRVAVIVNELGFSDYVYRRVDSDDYCSALVTTVPDELHRVYEEENYYDDDLVIAYAQQNTQPIYSSQVYKYICDAPFETRLTATNRAIEKLNRRCGFFEYYCVPVRACHGNGNVLLSITDKGMSAAEFQLKIVPFQMMFRQLAKAVDYISSTKFSEFVLGVRETKLISITPKPLDILSRLANADMTIAQLASQLCISPITAHQHIAGVRKALGVKTNIAAVRKAIKLKLITFN